MLNFYVYSVWAYGFSWKQLKLFMSSNYNLRDATTFQLQYYTPLSVMGNYKWKGKRTEDNIWPSRLHFTCIHRHAAMLR